MRVHRRRLVVRAVDARVGQGDAADCDVDRAVEDEQLCQSHGLLMVSKLHTEASAEALRDEFDLELPVTSGLIELYPGVVSDDPEVWGRVPTKADRQMMADAPALASAQEAPFLGGVY